MKYISALFGLFGLLVLATIFAQVKVPFILQENKCVFVEVKVNDDPKPLLFFSQLFDKMPNRLIATQNDLTSKGFITLSTIESLSFFDYQFDKPMIAHLSTDKGGVSAMPGYLGILGAEIINRFNFIIDYSNKVLYLQPNRMYDLPIDTKVFPFRLVEEDNKVVVQHIIDHTDAAKQGIKAGDEILEVNRQPVKDLLWVKEQIKLSEGAVHLKIRNANNKVEDKTFRLTSL